MWVIVYCNEGMDQGYVYLRRALADDEILNERTFADQIGEIEDPDGYIPNCWGDIRVEFTVHEPKIEHDARNDCDRYLGSTCIWSGESFYFKREDY